MGALIDGLVMTPHRRSTSCLPHLLYMQRLGLLLRLCKALLRHHFMRTTKAFGSLHCISAARIVSKRNKCVGRWNYRVTIGPVLKHSNGRRTLAPIAGHDGDRLKLRRRCHAYCCTAQTPSQIQTNRARGNNYFLYSTSRVKTLPTSLSDRYNNRNCHVAASHNIA